MQRSRCFAGRSLSGSPESGRLVAVYARDTVQEKEQKEVCVWGGWIEKPEPKESLCNLFRWVAFKKLAI